MSEPEVRIYDIMACNVYWDFANSPLPREQHKILVSFYPTPGVPTPDLIERIVARGPGGYEAQITNRLFTADNTDGYIYDRTLDYYWYMLNQPTGFMEEGEYTVEVHCADGRVLTRKRRQDNTTSRALVSHYTGNRDAILSSFSPSGGAVLPPRGRRWRAWSAPGPRSRTRAGPTPSTSTASPRAPPRASSTPRTSPGGTTSSSSGPGARRRPGSTGAASPWAVSSSPGRPTPTSSRSPTPTRRARPTSVSSSPTRSSLRRRGPGGSGPAAGTRTEGGPARVCRASLRAPQEYQTAGGARPRSAARCPVSCPDAASPAEESSRSRSTWETAAGSVFEGAPARCGPACAVASRPGSLSRLSGALL